MNNCKHPDVFCINPYELIRKYQCRFCGEVIMCACEEEFARRFLPHQLNKGTELKTQRRVPVTLGFQKDICNTCRSLPEEAHPKAELYGRASKIYRYYWREIFFETTQRFADWVEKKGYDYDTAKTKYGDMHTVIEKEVINEIKASHEKSPKYKYLEESQSKVLSRNNVKVVHLAGEHIKLAKRKVGILETGNIISPEEFAASYYKKKGYEVLFTESVPFHALFGVLLWVLVQNSSDLKIQLAIFGDRTAFEENGESKEIRTLLPSDFGSLGYAQRRASAIEEHFAMLPKKREDLLWTFDYWIEASDGLRQYL